MPKEEPSYEQGYLPRISKKTHLPDFRKSTTVYP